MYLVAHEEQPRFKEDRRRNWRILDKGDGCQIQHFSTQEYLVERDGAVRLEKGPEAENYGWTISKGKAGWLIAPKDNANSSYLRYKYTNPLFCMGRDSASVRLTKKGEERPKEGKFLWGFEEE